MPVVKLQLRLKSSCLASSRASRPSEFSDLLRMKRYARITGTGSCLPPQRLTNADMVAMLAPRGASMPS